MHVVVCPDSFKESLAAVEVAEQIRRGFSEVLPSTTFDLVPLADGGEGTVTALVAAGGGGVVRRAVTGPDGGIVEAAFGLVDDGRTAVIELAAASGLDLVPPERRDPMTATSRGTGELVVAALDLGVRRVLLGLGGSATCDGGLGMLQALGVGLVDEAGRPLGPGGASLIELATIDVTGCDPRLADVQIEVAVDVDTPLCGPEGAARMFAPQKGATPRMVKHLDAGLEHLATVLAAWSGHSVAEVAGGGAAGGAGATLLAVLGVGPRSGIDLVMDAVALTERIRAADLVITGEGRLDGQSIRGKTPVGVARVAAALEVPVIAIVGSIGPDAHLVHALGIDAVFSTVSRPGSLAQALATAPADVAATAANVARALAVGAELSG